MKKYSVCIPVYASMIIKVEADTEEEAQDRALNGAEEPTLCHQCSREVEINGVAYESNNISVIEIK